MQKQAQEKQKQAQEKRKVKVPAGHILVTFWSDWFTYECGYSTHHAGTLVEQDDLASGKLLKDGDSCVVTEKFRSDDARTWDVTGVKIASRRGRAVISRP